MLSLLLTDTTLVTWSPTSRRSQWDSAATYTAWDEHCDRPSPCLSKVDRYVLEKGGKRMTEPRPILLQGNFPFMIDVMKP